MHFISSKFIMSCSAAEIAEKRRLALAKLQAKTTTVKPPSTSSNPKPPTGAQEQLGAKPASNFYRSPPQNTNSFNNKATTNTYSRNDNKSSSFLNALKAISSASSRELSRATAHPYQRPNGPHKPTLGLSPEKQKPTEGLASVFVKSVNCRVYMISPNRFAVDASGYHEKLIEVFKKMPTKSYDSQTRIWNFDIKDYPAIQQHVGDLKPYVVIGTIPKKVMDLCQKPPKPVERSVLASIGSTLAEKLMPFQEDGVWWVGTYYHGLYIHCFTSIAASRLLNKAAL